MDIDKLENNIESLENSWQYIISDFQPSLFSYTTLLKYSSEQFISGFKNTAEIFPVGIQINHSSYLFSEGENINYRTEIFLKEQNLILTCTCKSNGNKLCMHQSSAFSSIAFNTDLKIFFDQDLRINKLKTVALDFGLENQPNLEEYFLLKLENKKLIIEPALKEIIRLDNESLTAIQKKIVPENGLRLPPVAAAEDIRLIVFSRHRFYRNLVIELYEAPTGRDGKIKNPFKFLNPSELIWFTTDSETLKFYSAISRFQSNYETEKAATDIEALKAILANPLKLAFYGKKEGTPGTNANSVFPLSVQILKADFLISIHKTEAFFEITGHLLHNDRMLEIKYLELQFTYFIAFENKLYLPEDINVLNIIDFFKSNNYKVLIHESKYEEFRNKVLQPLEDKIKINYSYIRKANEKQYEEITGGRFPEKLIYLSESENYVLITPVVKYGNTEVPVFSRKQILARDHAGNSFIVERNAEEEDRFIAHVRRQHKDFSEQVTWDSLYLPRNVFIDENWFLEAFEVWRNLGVSILGFNELKENKINYHKARVSVKVISGIDWFNTKLDVRFGDQVATLRQLHKAVRNRNRYVLLDDGTQGILPLQWIEKFARFFSAGNISDEILQTSKMHFNEINALYEDEMVGEDVRNEISKLKSAVENFTSVKDVAIPAGLQAELREYQKIGLNWLNFLDEFNFGGCLADDMGLGKTIQVLAFLLLQREKGLKQPNLIIVPATLIFNWQQEAEKFAPTLKIFTHYGSERKRLSDTSDEYDIVLTSYGTLLSDIDYFKNCLFNYIILDESQEIKNPDSQRNKAVRMLQSRNKLLLSGTPVENNTYDLYGQLSFACPGLLGSKQFFRDHYSVPIDKFKEQKRAKELGNKIHPFILRRTKEQVAQELPEKTEVTIYCEMGKEQRDIYNAYEKEMRDYLEGRHEDEIHKHSLHILKSITKLRQVCNSPAILNEDIFYGDASSKIEVLLEQIESKSTQHKILVFSQFVTMLDLIRNELDARKIKYRYLTGKTQNRKSEVEIFQEDEDTRVFLISLKAGGKGLNLTQADYVFLVDPWWNPAVENQAIDRAFRIGQKKNVVAVRLICPGTIEEKMMKLQESKRKLSSDLVHTDASIFKSLSKKDLLELIKS